MPKSENTAAEGFAHRLRALMLAAGRVSDSARSGVDVAALAQAAGTSYEMARRYAEGRAVPRARVLRRIADWLGVSPSSLAWGSADEKSINAEVLQQCIQAVGDAQAVTGVVLTTERAAALVAALYQEAIDGRLPQAKTVARLIRAMA